MKYVVAIDASALAREAAEFACKLGKPGDSVLLVHVVERQSMDGLLDEEGSSITMAAVMEGINAKNEARGQQLLDRSVEELQRAFPALAVAGKLLGGYDARAELVRALDEDLDADMLVTGSRGVGTMERIVLGSVSDYLSKNSSVPVLVYRKR